MKRKRGTETCRERWRDSQSERRGIKRYGQRQIDRGRERESFQVQV